MRRRIRRAPDHPTDDETPTARSGRIGEDSAARFLRRKGYRLLGRRVRTRGAEIDLLFRHRRTLVAVEVKTRRHDRPEGDLSESQIDRLSQAVLELRSVHRHRIDQARLDLIGVRLDRRQSVLDVLHIEGIRWFP